MDKIYIIEFSPDRWYDTIETDILGVFSTKEEAEEALDGIKNNYSKWDYTQIEIIDYKLDSLC